MKKMNAKGFTLIELLAVITIMGILMIVAIPAVTRTIENTRKSSFVTTAQNYVNGAKNLWASDNLKCGDYVSSAVAEGYYYIPVDSKSDNVPHLLESGGESSWGGRHMRGHILVHVDDIQSAGADGTLNTNDDIYNREVTYYPVIVDGIHGINVANGGAFQTDLTKLIASEDLVRGDLIMSGAEYTKIGLHDDATDTFTALGSNSYANPDPALAPIAPTICKEV